jgi:hypothetical protein
VYNRENLNGKNVQHMYAAHLHTSSKCSSDTNSLHTKEISIMHYSMILTAKELKHSCVKQGKYVRKQRRLEENTQHINADAVLWKEDSKYMKGAYDE